MLPRSRRLTSPAEFREVVRRGHRRGGSLLAVHLLVRDGVPSPSRAGLVVSKAVGPAVTRNLVKRRLRHLLLDRIKELPAGALLVVRAQPAAATATHVDLAADLDQSLERIQARILEPARQRSRERHDVGAAS